MLGPITIGHDSRIGANAVVVKPVPPGSVVVGVPGQVIGRSRPRPEPDTGDSALPDLVGASLQSLLTRVGRLEALADGQGIGPVIRPPRSRSMARRGLLHLTEGFRHVADSGWRRAWRYHANLAERMANFR